MNEVVYSPVLDCEMIENNLELFSSVEGFWEEYEKSRKSLSGKCRNCGTSRRREFAQLIRNKVVENDMKSLVACLDPDTIIRYGRKIYRASDLT